MKNIIRLTSFLIISLLFSGISSAQCDNLLTGNSCNTIITSVPYVRIINDARSGGMGDNRLTVTPDANAIFYNSSKLAFVDRKFGFSGGFTPWLRSLGVKNVWLGTFSGYVSIDQSQTIGVSLRHFSLGTVFLTDQNGQPLGNSTPRETDFALSYNRQLSERFAAGLTLRYIHSSLADGYVIWGETIVPGKAVASDISFTYKAPIADFTELTLAGAISNLGSKISYTQSANKDFIPTNLGIGGGVRFILGDGLWIHTALDINRLLVPTPPLDPFSPENAGGGDPTIPDYKEKSIIAAALGSFSDAPGGFKEEMQENNYSLGAEIHLKYASIRLGHFNEHKLKGGRKYSTIGLGANYGKYVALDFSYLWTHSEESNPLDKTFRLSLLVNFIDTKPPVVFD